MKKYLLSLLLAMPLSGMEEQPAQDPVPIAPSNLEGLARAEHHHSMTITVSEDDTYGPPPLSPKTLRHQYAMRKMKWGMAIAIVTGVCGIAATFFGTFFGKSCP